MNKAQIALSIEQMRELQSLGLDCSDASMAWLQLEKDWLVVREAPTCTSEIIPAYTLEDIVLKLDGELSFNHKAAKNHYQFEYHYLLGDDWRVSLLLGFTWGTSYMDAAFKALKTILKHYPERIKRL